MKLLYRLLLIYCLMIGVIDAKTSLIVKYKTTINNSHNVDKKQQLSANNLLHTRIDKISAIAGIKFTAKSQLATGAQLVSSDESLGHNALIQTLKQLNSQDDVLYAEENRLMFLQATTSLANPYQWDMSGLPQYGDNFSSAWNYFTNINYSPGQGVVVAVLDTGYIHHPNFITHLVNNPESSTMHGYDFISDCDVSGDCLPSESNFPRQRKADGIDLGAIATTSPLPSSDCSSDTWHGSHVTGTIVAEGYDSNTQLGILGGAYGAQVLPIRILGRCGSGMNSDIIDGALWAVGIHVDGIPDNTNPAKVINLSLGGQGACMASTIDMINQVNAAGAIMVVAAGNSSMDVKNFSPANCPGVISVAATGATGELSYYSNYGSPTIAASGGDFNKSSGILSTISSNTSAAYDSTDPSQYIYAMYQGTSMATPHVSAAIALLFSESSSLSLNTITNLLQKSAAPIVAGSNPNVVNNGRLDVGTANSYLLISGLFLTPSTDNLIISDKNIHRISFMNNTNTNIKLKQSMFNNNDSNLFTISSDACSNQVLPSMQSCDINLYYSGFDNNAHSTKLQLFNQLDDQVAQVNLSTIFSQIVIQTNPSQILLTNDNPMQTIELKNIGTNIIPLGLISLNFANDGIKQLALTNNTCIGDLAPNQGCSIKLSYTSLQVGSYQGNLLIYTTGNILVVNIPIATNITNNLLQSSESDVLFTNSNQTHVLNFTNPYQYAITLQNIQILQLTTQPRDFNSVFSVESNSCNGVLQSNANCTVIIKSNNTSSNAVNGKLIIYDNSNIAVAIVNLNANANPALSNVSSGGGGCSVVNQGDDYSLLILLLGVILFNLCKSKTIKPE